mmetsp:Transcript_150181/g.262380  ORF Transcript_150181/g.262380 Transcript_150181/m.262380 type:complete len:86 (+) Transcript_150181:797-1054(+)
MGIGCHFTMNSANGEMLRLLAAGWSDGRRGTARSSWGAKPLGTWTGIAIACGIAQHVIIYHSTHHTATGIVCTLAHTTPLAVLWS